MNKEDFLQSIKKNIDDNGLHITVVKSSENPRFAYTIGNLERLNFELVLAGAENFLHDDVIKILNEISRNISEKDNYNDVIEVSDIGNFKLSVTDDSWLQKMLLGVYDYYKIENFKAFQVLPYESRYYGDIPNMSNPWTSDDIIWKWLDDTIKWNLPVPKDSKVITEIAVLYGEKVTEVMRWEENEWEAFTQDGDNIEKDNIRVVPIATLLGIDKTLTPIVNLKIEKGLWRQDGTSEWNNWG